MDPSRLFQLCMIRGRSVTTAGPGGRSDSVTVLPGSLGHGHRDGESLTWPGPQARVSARAQDAILNVERPRGTL
jgi:hypothetical protein